jgi:hypothetical protein
MLLVLCALPIGAQTAPAATPVSSAQQESVPAREPPVIEQRLGKNFFNLLNMAGTTTAGDFTPMNQRGRNQLFVATMVNPLSFARVAFSAGLDQWNNKPGEWGQGSEAYGQRYANIFGQYSIQRTVSFALSSALDEDNRYFNSGKKGFLPRMWYAIESGILARHRDGHRTFSFSQVGGVAAGALIARVWLPPSEDKMSNAATSFGISTAANLAAGIVKEFVPDIIHVFAGRSTPPN